jgi:hypothetical protein
MTSVPKRHNDISAEAAQWHQCRSGAMTSVPKRRNDISAEAAQ